MLLLILRLIMNVECHLSEDALYFDVFSVEMSGIEGNFLFLDCED